MKVLYEKFCFLNSCQELELSNDDAKKMFSKYGYKFIDDKGES